jgi:hypothetical protein
MEKESVLAGVSCVMIGMLFSSAFAIAPVGPPTAGLKAGQWSFGFDYAHGEIDADIDWSSDFVSDIPDSKIKDAKSDAYLAKIGFGSGDWDFYLFLGAADIRGKIEDEGGVVDGSLNFDGGHNLSGGFGTKWTIQKEEKLSWGLVYQMSWSQGDDDFTFDLSDFGFGTAETIDVDNDSFDIFLALGPTYEFQNWRIYGGPALFYYDSDIEVEFMDVTILNGDVEEAMFGGYVGTEVDLDQNTSLYAEYMLADDAWMLGTGIVWKF